MKSKFGFTLVEIMIVISIIAVLALPLIARAGGATLTTINEASFNNIEKLAPALNTNFTNLNAALQLRGSNVVATLQSAAITGTVVLVQQRVTLTDTNAVTASVVTNVSATVTLYNAGAVLTNVSLTIQR